MIERGSRFIPSGYSHRGSVAAVSERFLFGATSEWRRPFDRVRVRKLALQLDPYYRTGIWWWDRVSVALGYVWAALLAEDAHLSYAALFMALEALCNTDKFEITHQLAERCAVLAGPLRELIE